MTSVTSPLTGRAIGLSAVPDPVFSGAMVGPGSAIDPAREAWMVQDLLRANRGPLSADGLREIYAEILALTKREVSGRAAEPA